MAYLFIPASPFGRVQKIAIVDGIPFIYGDNDVSDDAKDINVGQGRLEAPNSGEEIANSTDDEGSGEAESNPKELKRSALRLAIARRSQGLKDDKDEQEKGHRLDKYTPALSIGQFRIFY